MDRTSLKAGLAGLVLSATVAAFAGPVMASPDAPGADSLAQTVAADEARVRSLENEVVSTQEALDEAKSAKPVDLEAIDCAREANDTAKTKLTAAKKKLQADRSALAKAERNDGRGSAQLAGGAR